METPNYYTVLGVSPNSTPEQLTIAFSRQVEHFPAEERDPANNVAFRLLVTAYKVLSNPESRAAFDQTLATHAIIPRALNIQLLSSHTQLAAIQEPQLLYLLLEIAANPKLLEYKTPLNLCLVIDRSTSMSGDRINQVKAAASLIVEQLTPGDNISVVAFGDHAELIIPAVSIENIQLIKSKISQISTEGATEILKGLRLGVNELSKTRQASGISHLVLLTDGHTYGDERACIELSQKAAEKDVSISALGIGHQWNDRFLDELVAPSGGTSAYLEYPKQVITHLETRIKELSRAFAQGVQLQLDLPGQMSVRSIHKLSPTPSPVTYSNLNMPLGTLQNTTPITVLVELAVPPHLPGTSSRIRASVVASILPTHQRNQRFTNELELSYAQNPVRKPPLPSVVRAVNKLNLYRLNEKVWEDVEQGEIRQAVHRMERLATRLHHSGQTDLARTAMKEAQHIAQTGHLSAAGRKKLKYGTRSLIGYDNLS